MTALMSVMKSKDQLDQVTEKPCANTKKLANLLSYIWYIDDGYEEQSKNPIRGERERESKCSPRKMQNMVPSYINK